MRFFILTVLLFIVFPCIAQKQNVYFLRNDGKRVTTKDSADFIRIITEPDSGSLLYHVYEYYKNDKKKLIGKSSTIDFLRFDEKCVTFYPNCKRESVVNYKNGFKSEDEYDFYPNGRTYRVVTYIENKSSPYQDDYLIKENYDSLGTALVVDGNGLYKGFNDNFTYITEQGKVKTGKKDSVWKGRVSFSHVNNISLKNKGDNVVTIITSYIDYLENYKDGILLNGTAKDSTGKIYTYTKERKVPPQFKGGLSAFYQYISKNIRYPDVDRQTYTQGRVIVTFTVKTDGKVDDVKIVRGVSPTIDEVAKDIIQNSPKWIPGMQYGIPVNVLYSVPIAFSLTNR